MRYFDLHCDTIAACYNKNKPLLKNKFHIDLTRASIFDTYIQCYAAFIPDTLNGDEAFDYFCALSDRLTNEIEENSNIIEFVSNKMFNKIKLGAVLTLENASLLNFDLNRISELSKRKVKIVTLTWNGENCIGRGVLSEGQHGLSDFGKKVIKEFENHSIIVDVSHASPELFYDVASIAEKPFVATHSNSKKVCSNARNLTDEQFNMIKKAGGIVGLNFYSYFLNNDGEKASISDIFAHAEHFLSLGGEGCLCIGSDFDGADMPKDVKGIESIPKIAEFFLRHNYSEDLVNKIFFENAYNFFTINKLF